MIPVAPVPEPDEFAEAKRRGLDWLAANPQAERPAPYWRPFRRILREGFQRRCGYTAMYEPAGTVDHFASVKNDATKAYDWGNYRFASAWINSAKKPAGDGQWVDPYEVQAGWFEVQLPDMQLRAGPGVPPSMAAKVAHTLKHLPIRDDERVIDQRREWYDLFKNGELSLAGLGRMAPLIAEAVRRFNAQRSQPEDSRHDLP